MSDCYERAPANLRGGLQRYIEHGISPGGFLTLFLSNDLMGALGKADDINRNQFFEIALFLYNNAPGGCYGSPERVQAWMQKRQAAVKAAEVDAMASGEVEYGGPQDWPGNENVP